MSGSDGSHGQSPYRPGWEPGPSGMNSPGGQFVGPNPAGGQHPAGGQYPAVGQYMPDGQYVPDGEYMPDGQYVPDGEYMPDGQYVPDGRYPAAGQYPVGVQYPAGQYPVGVQYPAVGVNPPVGQYPPAHADPTANPLATRSAGPDPAKLLGLAVAGLGGLNFIWGFLPELTAPRIDSDLSVFAVGPAYVPILLLIAGLLALAALIPGSERSRLAVAAVSVGGAAGAIVSLGTAGPVELLATGQVSKGLGAVLLVVFGIIQAVVAIAGYVVGADFSQRAPDRADDSVASGLAAPVQPGWFDTSTGGGQTGFDSPLGSVRPGVPQTWWPSAPDLGPARMGGAAPVAGHAPWGAPVPMAGPAPSGGTDPSEAVTGPQTVIGTERRLDGETDSPPGGVPGRQP